MVALCFGNFMCYELKKLSLPELTPTRMTLELADRSITRPKGVTGDVFVKVEKFHFLTDFVVVDFEADPRVPFILRRSFLRTGHALIDVYGEEITLRVNDKAITFNLNQTTRYSSIYDDLSVNRIDIINVAREEYAWEILGFYSNSWGGNPTLTFEPILSDFSLSLTPFEGNDSILEEINAYLKEESILPEIDHADCDLERDICLIEKLLSDDPFQLPPMNLKQRESSALLTLSDEPASLVRDVSKGEACPTNSGFIADQDRATIAKSSTLPHDSAPRVTSPAADEGNVVVTQFGDDAPIKGRSINEGEAAAKRISNDSEEIAKVLTSIDAATVLAGGIDVPTGSGSIPTAGPPATIISTGSEVSSTASPIVTRRKGKEVMVESDTPKKKKLQEQIDAQVARELEEQQEKENMRINEQIARDAEVARIHTEEELQGIIDSLDQSNETIAKYLQEYQDFASDLQVSESTEKANDQEAKEGILYSCDQKQLEVEVEDFIPMGSKDETERLKRKGLNLEKEQVKKQKLSEEAPEIVTSTEEFTKEKIKEMM
nr:reverse transcriptase domain-containing protein [Tanacetum cinerariifolium]